MNPKSLFNQIHSIIPTAITGTVVETAGTTVSVADFPVPVGSLAEIERRDTSSILAEVIGFHDQTAILYPYQSVLGIRRSNRVRLVNSRSWLNIGDGVLGKILDAQGNVLDSRTNEDGKDMDETEFVSRTERVPFLREAPKSYERPRIIMPISTGIRAIDALLTLGEGQRVGIFAGSGVGKSVLLGMIARWTSADVIVIGLIGERGRELNDFIERDLGKNGLRRSVLVVATSDEPAILRVRAAQTATAVAEYFRDQGKNVLLLMDSLTRVAMAQREIGTAAGEPMTRNGFPPSVFAMLPPLVERTGRTKSGNITAIYTVLVEGDDENEPIADATRGILDGHIWLSRKLANEGQYPAIDVPRSVSRLMKDICSKKHLEVASAIQKLISIWNENQDLITIGAYKKGSNPQLDRAMEKREKILRFLKQNTDESCTLESAVQEAAKILED